MTKPLFYATFILSLLMAACNPSIKPAGLYGTWKYTRVEHPNADPPDSLTSEVLASQSPSIEFLNNNQYLINWGGKVLSHGSFTVDGMNIRIKETLADGTKREFPFYVSELTDKEIVFDTKGEDGSKVTAVKQ